MLFVFRRIRMRCVTACDMLNGADIHDNILRIRNLSTRQKGKYYDYIRMRDIIQYITVTAVQFQHVSGTITRYILT